MQNITSLLKDIPKSSTAIKFFFGPIIELQHCYAQIFVLHRNIARNMIHFIVIALGIVLGGIILPLTTPGFIKFLDSVAPFLSLTGGMDALFNFYFGAWIISYPASSAAKSCINIYSLYYYGDTDYFLTYTRLEILANKAIEHEGETIEMTKPIEKIFVHNRNKLRSDSHELNPTQKAYLIAILEAFMYDNPEQVMIVYQEQKRLYKTYLWTHGMTADIFKNKDKIENAATRYGLKTEDINMVLEHCVTGLKAKSTTIGARPEDYIKVIQNILDGNDLGFLLFSQQQKIILEHRMKIEQVYQENRGLLEQLQELKRKRAPTGQSTATLPIEDQVDARLKILSKASSLTADDIANQAKRRDEDFKTEELENMAKTLLARHSIDGENSDIVPDEALVKLISFYTQSTKRLSKELHAIPHTTPLEFLVPRRLTELSQRSSNNSQSSANALQVPPQRPMQFMRDFMPGTSASALTAQKSSSSQATISSQDEGTQTSSDKNSPLLNAETTQQQNMFYTTGFSSGYFLQPVKEVRESSSFNLTGTPSPTVDNHKQPKPKIVTP